MPDWFGMKARKATKEKRARERALAWSALWDVATRTPFLGKVDASDPDSSFTIEACRTAVRASR